MKTTDQIREMAHKALNKMPIAKSNIDIMNLIVRGFREGYEAGGNEQNKETCEFAFRLGIREGQISNLFNSIKHGDEVHQKWLKEKIAEHFSLEDFPEARLPYENEQKPGETPPDKSCS